jgi:hypothetical protein
MDLEQLLNEWLDAHVDELFVFMREEAERFQAGHPGADYEEERLHATVMASRRYTVRALGQVLPAYLAALAGREA